MISPAIEEVIRLCYMNNNISSEAHAAERELRILQAEIARLRAALEIMRVHNPIHNDLEAYLMEVADWGLGERDTQPNLIDFGLAACGADSAA